MNLPKDTERAWFAGLIDGEGYIRIKETRHSLTKNDQYQARLVICMTHLETLEKVRLIWGVGNINSRKVYNAKWKPEWVWEVCGRQCAQILTLSYDYLVTKRADALIAITLQKRTARSKKSWGKSVPIMENERRRALEKLSRAVKTEVVLAQNIEAEINQIFIGEPRLQLEVDKL